MAKMVKNLPTVQETRVPFLDWEEPLEEGTATYSGIFILFYFILFVCFDCCRSLLLLGFFSSWSVRERLFIVLHRPLLAVASPTAEHRL